MCTKVIHNVASLTNPPVARSRQTDVVTVAQKNFPKIYSFSSISHHYTFRSKRFYSGKFITCV